LPENSRIRCEGTKEVDPAEMKNRWIRCALNCAGPPREYFNAYIQEIRKMEAGKQIKINESVVNQIASSIAVEDGLRITRFNPGLKSVIRVIVAYSTVSTPR
jgi:hypothetical protein